MSISRTPSAVRIEQPPLEKAPTSESVFRPSDPELSKQRSRPMQSTLMQLEPAQEFAANRHLLVRIDANYAGQVMNLENGAATVFGRQPDCTVCLNDDGISRVHARITPGPAGAWLEDLGSSNGTYVNGERIKGRPVRSGDVIQFGLRVSYRYNLSTEAEENAMRQLYDSSVRDALTGAYNRQYLTQRLTSEVAYAERHKTPLSLVMLDIDHFKKINDSYGHPAGDAVIKAVSERLERALRTEDLVARFGGEEFVCLLRGIPLENARMAAERIRIGVSAQPIRFDGLEIRSTISLGVSCLNCVTESTGDALIATADKRLYVAKESGRNRVVAA